MDNNACYSKYGSYDDCVAMIGEKLSICLSQESLSEPLRDRGGRNC